VEKEIIKMTEQEIVSYLTKKFGVNLDQGYEQHREMWQDSVRDSEQHEEKPLTWNEWFSAWVSMKEDAAGYEEDAYNTD
jgi:hypothetical protein